MVENQGIPCFPDVPKQEEHDVWSGPIREGKATAEGPWHAVLSRQWQVANAKPYIMCPGTFNKNMCIGFQLGGAKFTVRLISPTKVPVMEVRVGVSTAMEEQPAKELDLVGKLHLPNTHKVSGGRGDWVQGLIGTAGSKGGIWRICQTAQVRLLSESECGEAIQQQAMFSSDSSREPGSEKRLVCRAECRHGHARPYAM